MAGRRITGLVLAVLFGTALSLVELGSSFAEDPSEAQILDALTPKGTRSLVRSAREQRRSAEELRFIQGLRTRSARSLTLRERETITQIAMHKPSIDIEINFEYNSDVIGPTALRPLVRLGKALSNEQIKGSVFFVSGHTDAKGSVAYNQDLSERRAEAVKHLLVKEFDVPPDSLIAVGYGKTQLKDKTNPFAGENRRVQVVNTEQHVTATRP
jgi:outer membrane protein OmpA-like peptidoglycan-associated protein